MLAAGPGNSQRDASGSIVVVMAPPLRPLQLGLLSTAVAAVCDAAPVSTAQQGAGDQRIAFDIPAQSLDTALTDYFRRTGVQLLYDSALTTGRRSSAVRGNFAPREALRLLLRGTGLIARYSRSNAAILSTAEARSAAPLVPLGRVIVRERITVAPRASAIARMHFYGELERVLQTYLRSDPRTERLRFRMRVSFRIASDGELTDVHVAHGSGDARTDRLVAAVLTGRGRPIPPDDIAQPLVVALTGRRPRED